MKRFKTIREKVKEICEVYPHAKTNSNILVARYHWFYHYRRFGLPYKEVMKLPSPETITRRLRELKETGEIKIKQEEEVTNEENALATH